MIDDVGISAVRTWIRSTTNGIWNQTTRQFLPENGEWLRRGERWDSLTPWICGYQSSK